MERPADTDPSTVRCLQATDVARAARLATTLGALVYFPRHLLDQEADRPVLLHPIRGRCRQADHQGAKDFTGIALFDTDPYIPGENGNQWYINQNQFYRQIRNFILDMTDMPFYNYDEAGVQHVPCGIHWLSRSGHIAALPRIPDAGRRPRSCGNGCRRLYRERLRWLHIRSHVHGRGRGV